jgi:hypothetical protein
LLIFVISLMSSFNYVFANISFFENIGFDTVH